MYSNTLKNKSKNKTEWHCSFVHDVRVLETQLG